MNATEEDIVFLWDLLEKEKESERTVSKMTHVNINKAFHMYIAKMGKNKYLEHYCRNIFWRSHAYLFFFDNYYTGQVQRQS